MRRPVLLLAAAMLTGCSGSTGGDDAGLVESRVIHPRRADGTVAADLIQQVDAALDEQ